MFLSLRSNALIHMQHFTTHRCTQSSPSSFHNPLLSLSHPLSVANVYKIAGQIDHNRSTASVPLHCLSTSAATRINRRRALSLCSATPQRATYQRTGELTLGVKRTVPPSPHGGPHYRGLQPGPTLTTTRSHVVDYPTCASLDVVVVAAARARVYV